jgi:hypothetical protein
MELIQLCPINRTTKEQSADHLLLYFFLGHSWMISMKLQLNSFFHIGARWWWMAKPRPGRFTPGKETWYPLYKRLDGAQGRSGRMRKISQPAGFYPQTVQPVASCYTYLAILANVPCPVSSSIGQVSLQCFMLVLPGLLLSCGRFYL